MEKIENLIFKDFGTFTNTNNHEQYEINKVIIFKDGEEKMIANYFLDNFSDYRFTYYGNTKRKLKKDLTSKENFVIKSESQNSWNDRTQYTLYINGDLNDYKFTGLKLVNKQLQACYILNNLNCEQCIGWNQKESNKIKYNELEKLTKKIDSFTLEHHPDETLKNIKELEKLTKKYIKVKETEKSYTENDYKKMQLESGTTKEENLTILKNNGLDIGGIK